MRKPVVGEVLYSLNVGNAARGREKKLTPVEVLSVGKKYFTCNEVGSVYKHTETKYHIDTWREKTDYSVHSELYESEQHWSDEQERQALANKLKDAFNHYGKVGFTLEQLRNAWAALNDGAR